MKDETEVCKVRLPPAPRCLDGSLSPGLLGTGKCNKLLAALKVTTDLLGSSLANKTRKGPD